MHFLENKYTNLYFKLIIRAKTRKITSYVEKHHIIPRSMNGDDNKDNIIELTAKEHFLAHHLLTKMTTGVYRKKLNTAFFLMSTMRNPETQKKFRITSKVYENTKLNCHWKPAKKYDNLIKLEGTKIGNLLLEKLIIERDVKNYIKYYWECKCDCGNNKKINHYYIKDGTTSCGCLRTSTHLVKLNKNKIELKFLALIKLANLLNNGSFIPETIDGFSIKTLNDCRTGEYLPKEKKIILHNLYPNWKIKNASRKEEIISIIKDQNRNTKLRRKEESNLYMSFYGLFKKDEEIRKLVKKYKPFWITKELMRNIN